MSSVLMQFTPLPQNAARLEKPHALAAKLRAILGDKVIKDWKWLQTTIMHADRASGASTTLGIYFEIFILGDFGFADVASHVRCADVSLPPSLNSWFDVALIEPTALVAATPDSAPHKTAGD